MRTSDTGGGIDTPRQTLPGQKDFEPAYSGQGDYNPFPEGIGGGGGGYVPPVTPNPTFVPPSYLPKGTIKIHLISNEVSQFTENDTSVGNGLSITLEKPAVSFGPQKIYKSVVNGKRTTNYFVVSIDKQFNGSDDIISSNTTNEIGTSNVSFDKSTNTQNSFNLDFNYAIGPETSTNDYVFAEVISVKEYQLDTTTGQYNFLNERKVPSNSSFIDLNFTFEERSVQTPPNDTNSEVGFQIAFKSNYANEIGDKVFLKYDIVDSYKNIVISDSIPLNIGETDTISLQTSTLKDCNVNMKIDGDFPSNYKINGVYYINSGQLITIKSVGFSNWNKVTNEFSISGNELLNGIVVDVEFDKEQQIAIKPSVSTGKSSYDIRIKESDNDSLYNLLFSTNNADYVDVYLPNDSIYRIPASKGFVQFQFSRDFKSVFGKKEILLVANSNSYGKGDRVKVILNYQNANDFPEITQIIFPSDIEIPGFSDLNVSWDVTYKTFAASSVDVYLLAKDLTKLPLFSNITPNGKFTINLSDLVNKFPLWNGSNKLTLVFKPYNRASETEHIGNEYEVTTNIIYPSIKLDEDIIRKSIYDAFIDKLKFTEPEKESKYLTHLLNFGNDEHSLISSWEEDNWTLSEKGEDELGNEIVKKEVKSIILKLYEPLPATYPVNTTVWITKLMSNPLVETVVLNEQETNEDPYIKGPNFDIDVDFVRGQSTDYESLDDLIISASSSTTLIQNYLSASLVDTTDLNIEYVKIPQGPNPPTNLTAVVAQNGDYAPGTFYHNYRIYSYRNTEDGGREYSKSYLTLSTNLEGSTSTYYGINLTWDYMPDVDGYRILKYDNYDYHNYDAGWDTDLNYLYDNYTGYTYDDPAVDIRYAIWDSRLASVLSTTSVGAYAWENFVHFSSATERVNNFVYKVQLIENYEQLIVSASTDYTGGGNASWTASLSSQQEVQRLNTKKSSLIQGFDGFEKFLYNPSSQYSNDTEYSLTWPYSGPNRLSSKSTVVINWYENLIDYATLYDNKNTNWLVNNIPQFIRFNPENDQFLLFFSMIGHHFDNIYFYTKAIERSRGLSYNSTNGVANKLLYDTLKSFSWDAKNLGHDKALWNYVFGEDKAGGNKESTPSNERSKEVWRRIVNNLPYLLKHKGTRRGIYALMACYGIPSSNLSIMEFGGPEVTDDNKNKLMLDGTSYSLSMKSGNSISIGSISNAKTIELFVKPAKAGNYNVVSDGTNNIIISGSIGSIYGKVKFGNLETPLLPLFNGRYFGICLSNNTSNRTLNVMQVEADRLIFSASVNGSTALGTSFTIGSTFSGSIDEFRIWNTPLSSSVFEQHVYYPEMINGNHISASTTDLELRFDFEYPKDLSSKTKILNVAPGIKLNVSSSRNYYEDSGLTTGLIRLRSTMPYNATAASFTSVVDYPYQFEVINRNFVLEMPDIGVSRYATNKVRIEEQTLLSDLSSKYRSTKKAFDNQPIDSNRVGLFFSPNKELNLDIAKSLGDTNLNEYIGDPSDRYKPGYKALDSIKDYYFQRIQNRDIYSYINLIRAYEKAMFEDIKKMLPARVTATTGILIEPHFLERSKYQYTKPTGSSGYYETETQYTYQTFSENNQFETIVNADLGEQLSGENEQFDSIINADLSENIVSENEQYESIIYANDEIDSTGEFFTYETAVLSNLDKPTLIPQDLNEQYNQLLGTNDYQDIGFSVYAQNGVALYSYYDNFGLVKERVQLTLIEEQKTKVFEKYNIVINGVGDPRGGFVETSSFYTEKKLIIQPITSSVAPIPPSIGGNILSVTPVNGYLPTHHRYTTDLTAGMKNSYYNGSKNTAATTLDGTPPVEVFVTNPNTIKVVGRDNNEPILDVE